MGKEGGGSLDSYMALEEGKKNSGAGGGHWLDRKIRRGGVLPQVSEKKRKKERRAPSVGMGKDPVVSFRFLWGKGKGRENRTNERGRGNVSTNRRTCCLGGGRKSSKLAPLRGGGLPSMRDPVPFV